MKYSVVIICCVILPLVVPSPLEGLGSLGPPDLKGIMHQHCKHHHESNKSKRSTPEESIAISEFCSEFQPTQEEILKSQGEIEEMSSGCNGICSYCKNCSANCYHRILRACKQYLNGSYVDVRSNLRNSCRAFIEKKEN